MTDGRPWQITNPEALHALHREIEERYPELTVVVREDRVVLSGMFPLTEGGRVVDRYRIELTLPSTYPNGVPTLRELDGRIPQTADRHMESSGACVSVPDEYYYQHPDGLDAIAYLEGPVRSYLVGQSLVEAGKDWPFPPRPHGVEGILEFYQEQLGDLDRAVIADCLAIALGGEIRGHVSCPCGERRIRNCHRAALSVLRERIPRDVMERSIWKLRER